MLCRWICWCDMEIFCLWADGEVVHSCTTRPWTWMELWVDYGAFLLHGELRHLAETFGLRLVCLLECWLEMTHGAHDDMRLLWLLETSYMVDLDDLTHWGVEVIEFDAGWDAYFWVHVWVWLGRVTWCGGSIWDTLEWWSYNDDDALVATLRHGLSWDLTTLTHGSWLIYDHGQHMDRWDKCILVSMTLGMAHCR